jgi:hypothetical protein
MQGKHAMSEPCQDADRTQALASAIAQLKHARHLVNAYVNRYGNPVRLPVPYDEAVSDVIKHM